MTKKLILPILILMLILLAACGSKPGTEQTPNESAKVSETASPKNDKDDSPEIDYYSMCTEQDAETVEGFAAEVREQILDKDWESLAENVSFPITVGTKVIPNKDEFIATDWDSILSDDFYGAIEAESCENLFCNSEGIMLGNGQVWFAELLTGTLESQGLKVISINP